MNFRIIDGFRQHSKVYVDTTTQRGYVLDKIRGTQKYLKCYNVREVCQARARIDENKLTQIGKQQHICTQDAITWQVLDVRNQMKRLAYETSEDLQSIYNRVISSAPPAVLPRLTWLEIHQMLKDARHRRYPETLATVQDIEEFMVNPDRPEINRYFRGMVTIEQDTPGTQFLKLIIYQHAFF